MRLLQQSCGEAGDDDDEESSSVWRDLGGRVTMTSPNVSLFFGNGGNCNRRGATKSQPG